MNRLLQYVTLILYIKYLDTTVGINKDNVIFFSQYYSTYLLLLLLYPKEGYFTIFQNSVRDSILYIQYIYFTLLYLSLSPPSPCPRPESDGIAGVFPHFLLLVRLSNFWQANTVLAIGRDIFSPNT